MQIKTIFAGFGGQGVLMMGYSFAQAAMFEGFHVTYLPSYGVEVRGGTANCTVAVSNEEIASPVASQPDYLVVMNNPSLMSFQTRIAPGGAFFLNSSIITGRPNRSDVDIWESSHGGDRLRAGQPPRAERGHDGRLREDDPDRFRRELPEKPQVDPRHEEKGGHGNQSQGL